MQLFTRTRSNVELTEAGTELLHRGRRLLADLDGAVTGVRMAGRGETGLIRIGVAHLAEPAVAPTLTAFQAEHASIAVDRSAMVSERLLEQLAEGRLHVAVIHQVPGLAALDAVRTEPLRRGRLAVLAGPETKLAGRPAVTLSELAYLRHYRDQHRWLSDPDATPLTPDRRRHFIAGGSRKHSRRAHTKTTANNDTPHQRTRPA